MRRAILTLMLISSAGIWSGLAQTAPTPPEINIEAVPLTLLVVDAPAGQLPPPTVFPQTVALSATIGCTSDGTRTPFVVQATHSGSNWPAGLDLQIRATDPTASTNCTNGPLPNVSAYTSQFLTIPAGLLPTQGLSVISGSGLLQSSLEYRINMNALPLPGSYSTTVTYTILQP